MMTEGKTLWMMNPSISTRMVQMLMVMHVRRLSLTIFRWGHIRDESLRFHEVESAGWSGSRERISTEDYEKRLCTLPDTNGRGNATG
jgi:hypothetical protein